MEKIAKLIEVSFTTRIIVAPGATEEDMIALAKKNILPRIPLDFGDNVTSIEDDEACPYGTFKDDLNA